MKRIILTIVMALGFVVQSSGQEDRKMEEVKKEIQEKEEELSRLKKISKEERKLKRLKTQIRELKDITNNVKIINFDFEAKEIITPLRELERLKQGDFYQLQIDNINMNLYKVVFDKKDTIIVSDVEFPTFDLVNLGGVGELLNKINISSFSSTKTTEFEKKFNSVIFVDIPALLGNTSNVEDSKSIKERIDAEKINILAKDDIFSEEKNKTDFLLLKIQKKINSYSVLNKEQEQSYYQSLSGNVSFDELLSETENIRKKLVELQKALRKQQSEYLSYISKDNVKKIMTDKLKEDDKALQEAFAKSISNVDKLYESVNAEKVASWIKELIYKENNSVTSYTTLPQQLNGDQAKLNIQLIPLKEESGLPNYQTNIIFPQKREFYIGGGMSFYYAGFKNEAYSIKATVIDDKNTEYRIVDEKNKKGELGLTALIHFGWRPFYDKKRNDWFAVNLVTGPALSLTNTVKPRVAVGGGFAFGRKNMLTINGLYMGGYVDKKSENFNIGDTDSIKPENITVSKLEGAFALSLGYIYNF